jgi:N-methylhydantoinase B
LGAARELANLATRREARLDEGMRAIVDHTERLARARLGERSDVEASARAVLETATGTARLQARTRLTGDELVVDYAGTDAAIEGNLNAPRPVTEAGVTYVLRLLLGADVPSNAGLTRPVTVRVPDGSILDPPEDAAIAGGNVETSQRNVDLLLDALREAFPDRAPAHSQGTMNNVTLGGEDGQGFAYYETLGGGEGATPRRPGASGIHTHMTNTQNTPIETLEHALPLRVRALTLREDTGGSGEHAGGDGLERVLEAQTRTRVNLITNRRRTRPGGRHGGEDGASGRNRVVRADGSVEELGPIASIVLDEGDKLVVETPSGGGWGNADED